MKELLKDKKWLKETLIIIGIGIVINVCCFFVCSLTGHCANLQNSYPYYINETYSANGTYNGVSIVTDDVNALYNNYFSAYQDFIIQDFITRANISSSDKFIVTVSEVQYWSSVIEVDFNFFVNPTSDTVINENTIFSQTATTIHATRYKYRYQYRHSYNDVVYYSSYGSPVTSDYSIMGSASFQSGRSNWGDFAQILNYPLFMVGFDNGFFNSSNKPIIAYTGVSIGDFVNLPDLDSLLNNISNSWEPPSSVTGHALPSSPTENPNNNDFQNRLQMFQYLGDIITQNFGNLGYNLAKWFNGLQQKLTDGFNSVSQNIWNGFKTLMDNIKDYFGPKLDKIIEVLESIRDKAGYLSEDFDAEEVADYYEETCSLFELSSTMSAFHTQLSSTFTNVTRPQRLEFTIDFSHAPWPFSTIGLFKFNFDWYENLRNTIVPWILTFLYFGAVFSLGCQIPNIIHGVSGLFHPSLTYTDSYSYIDTSKNYSHTSTETVRGYSMFGGALNFNRFSSSSSQRVRRKG